MIICCELGEVSIVCLPTPQSLNEPARSLRWLLQCEQEVNCKNREERILRKSAGGLQTHIAGSHKVIAHLP